MVYDDLIQKIADYVFDFDHYSDETLTTALYCFMDTLGCGALALNYPACTKLLGPWVPGTIVPMGARVPGTAYVLDPIKAAFDISTLNRWLDYNDTWLAAEWGHPSDNLGAILACCDYQNRQNKGHTYTLKDVLTFMIQAHEIQGVLALNNSFNAVGLDHVLLVKIASTAVATKILGGTKEQVKSALSQAFVDGQSLRTYRHAPNTGSRKSWAAGDATARAVQLALMTLAGEIGYPTAISTPKWGFEAVLFKNQSVQLAQAFNSYVMDNILFKISYPAEFHGQTAVEAALLIHQKALKANIEIRPENVEKITLYTQSAACRIIDKKGPLLNPADRDHCLQYMVSVGLLFGELHDYSYEDRFASDARIDLLRDKMTVIEDLSYSKDYLDPMKRSIPNRVELTLTSGEKWVEEVMYPVGHKRRREEGIPLLLKKCKDNLLTQYSSSLVDRLLQLIQGKSVDLDKISVSDFMDWLV